MLAPKASGVTLDLFQVNIPSFKEQIAYSSPTPIVDYLPKYTMTVKHGDSPTTQWKYVIIIRLVLE